MNFHPSLDFALMFCCVTCLQVIIAAELLKLADELCKAKLHPTTIISGYRVAVK